MKKLFSYLKKILGPSLTRKIRPIGHGVKAMFANFWFGSPTHQSLFRDILSILSGYPLFNPDIKLIGINGTKGKTSTTIFTAKLLNQTGVKTGYISTALIYDGEKEYLNPYKMGTIDSWKMNELLDKMRYNRCEVIVLEMTSQGLEQNRHWGLKKFDTAVFLNAFPEHIEAHGGWKNYLKAKSKLFSYTKKDSNIFINGQEKQLEKFKEITDFVNSKLVSKWRVEKINSGQDFQIIKSDDIYLKVKIGENIYDTKLVADFEILDLFFAWKVACQYSKTLLDSQVIKKIFSEIGNLPGRMEWVLKNGQQIYFNKINSVDTYTIVTGGRQVTVQDIQAEQASPIQQSNKRIDRFSKPTVSGSLQEKTELKSSENLSIIVDYAHEPESLKLVLDTFLEWKNQGKFDYIIHVLSCDGAGRDDWKKPVLGDLSYSKADFTILTTDNYEKSDDPNEIINLLSKNFPQDDKATKFASNIDRFTAFKMSLEKAKPLIEKNKKVLIFSTGVGTEFGLTQPNGILTWDERQKWIEAVNPT